MMGVRIFTYATVLVSTASTTLAAEDRFVELRGSYSGGVDGTPWQAIERARLTFESDPFDDKDALTLVATVEVGLSEGRNLTDEMRDIFESIELPIPIPLDCTWPTHRHQLLGIDGVEDYLSVERLYVDYYGEHLDIRLGRQAVHWGSAHFFNPTDPFPEVLLSEPWRPRRGVNAVRLTVPFGEASEVAIVGGVDDTLQKGRAAGRLLTNWLETDWALIGAYRADGDAGLVGADIRGTLGVGFWLEAAARFANGKVFEELAVGIDYSFPLLDSLVLIAQYYRNGAGADDPDDYALALPAGVELPECNIDLSFVAPPDPFQSFTRGRDYLLLGATLQIIPELSTNLFALQNLNDGTALLVPTVSTRPTGWLEVALSAQLPLKVWGEGGELSPRSEDLTLGPLDLSGLVPDVVLTLWTRVSF